MRMRRLVTVLAAAGTLVSTSACGSASPKAGAGVTITYWATQQSASIATDQKILKAELARFTGQTGIKVHLEIPSWATLYSKILAAVTSGSGPDVLNIGNTWSASLQATGALLPFSADVFAHIGGSSRFVGTALSSTGAAGLPPSAVPLYGEAYALFYNRRLFAAAGITTPPATWADFVSDAHKLTKPRQWGLALPLGNGAANVHLAFILGRQAGAHLFDPGTGKAQLDSEAEVSAVSRALALMSTDHVIDPGNIEYKAFEAQVDVAHGKAAMTFAQTGALAYFAALGLKDVGVAPMPVVTPLPAGGAAIQSIVGGTNVAVFKDSPHRSAALSLVKFLTSDAEQVRLNADYMSLPVVTSAYQDSPFTSAAMTTFRAVLTEHAEPLPMVSLEGQMETALGGAIDDLWARAVHGAVSGSAVQSALGQANKQLAGQH